MVGIKMKIFVVDLFALTKPLLKRVAFKNLSRGEEFREGI
jgi:hypothetical protein